MAHSEMWLCRDYFCIPNSRQIKIIVGMFWFPRRYSCVFGFKKEGKGQMRLDVRLFAAIIFGLTIRIASADTLTLEGAGPTGTVVLAGTALPSAPVNYQGGVDCYAGILDWQDGKGNAVYTYCVDVASVINIGNSFNFSQVSPDPSSAPFTQTVLDAIEHLWADHPGAGNTLIPSAISDPSLPGASAGVVAADFQIALWDIISNAATLGVVPNTNAPLSFSSPSSGVDPNLAVQWAQTAYGEGAFTGADTQFDILISSSLDGGNPGQNQAFFSISVNPDTATPLPSSLLGGLGLFAFAGVLTRLNRHRIQHIA